MIKKTILLIMALSLYVNAEEIYATFNVEAMKSANLAFTSSGTINSVTVEMSSKVKKGDILATLENSEIKASLAISTIALAFSKKEYERQLKVKKLVDASQLDSYAFKYQNAKAQLIYKQSLFDKTILRAPFDSVVYEKLVELGDVVSGAMIRTILKVQSPHERKLVLEIDQKYWKILKIGQVFRYNLTGDKKEYTSKITKIYPSSNIKNRKIKAEVLARDIPVGLFGEGTINIVEVR